MRIAGIRFVRMALALLVACAVSLSGLARAQPAPRPTAFRTHAIVDAQQGGLVLGTITVPADWRVDSYVRWTYADVSHPVRSGARVSSPDGVAWLELFPAETFFWLDPVRATTAVGGRSLGMVHWPQLDVQQALMRFLVPTYRGKQPSLQVVGAQAVDPSALAAAFNQPPVPGQAAVVRLRYLVGGAPADELVYALVGSGNSVPYTGPQGTWYESHRPLLFAHAIGATGGQLERWQPILRAILGTLRLDPAWQAHAEQVQRQLGASFNAYIQRGYAQIAAAAATSRAISANNDAMLSSMQAQRQRQAQIDAQRRAAHQAGSGSTSSFSDAMRGITRLEDAWSGGEAWRSNTQSYHWTDGMGNYRSSNDASFDPNVGAGGGPTWKRMAPAR